MARRRYQRPTPKRVGDRWEIVVREDVEDASGVVSRKQRRITLGYTHEIATAKQAMRLAEPILAGINTNKPRHIITFGEVVERYRATILTEMAPSTQDTYKSAMRKWLIPALGQLQIHDITPLVVQSFIAKMRKSGISGKTVWNVICVLRDIWGSARSWGYAQAKIFDDIELRKPSDPEARFFTLDEVKRIVGAAREPYATLYLCAAETGMRAGELFALRFSDIDFEAAIITASRAVWRGRFKETKGRRTRRIPISTDLLAKLAALGIGKTQDALVFPTRKGTPARANVFVSRHLGPLLASLGIPHGGLHAFRHFNGTFSLASGASTAAVRDRLGHTSLTMTNRYVHRVTEEEREIADRLGHELAKVYS